MILWWILDLYVSWCVGLAHAGTCAAGWCIALRGLMSLIDLTALQSTVMCWESTLDGVNTASWDTTLSAVAALCKKWADSEWLAHDSSGATLWWALGMEPGQTRLLRVPLKWLSLMIHLVHFQHWHISNYYAYFSDIISSFGPNAQNNLSCLVMLCFNERLMMLLLLLLLLDCQKS